MTDIAFASSELLPVSIVALASGRQSSSGLASVLDQVTIRSRGRLPHWERGGGTYFVTFRLAETLPEHVLHAWKAEQERMEAAARGQGRELTEQERRKLRELYTERVEAYLDAGRGSCWLRDERIAGLVVRALRFFDGQRYRLHAWCVMPNHVHVVLTEQSRQDAGATGNAVPLASVLHSWKSYTAKEANRILGRRGEFWQREYYDHLIRDEEDFYRRIEYTLQNPVKAGLCERWEDWPWSDLGEEGSAWA